MIVEWITGNVSGERSANAREVARAALCAMPRERGFTLSTA